MRGKSSSRVNKSMEVAKEEPQLSGAYIRSLVKHLSSSTRPKVRILNPNSPNSSLEDRLDEPQQLQSPPPPPQQLKKQVRRRLHTSRPYQERLLNMAEARREIVTALKLHRASMKQQQQQQQEVPPPTPNPNPHPNMYQVPNPSSFSSFTYPTLSWSYPTLAPLPDIPENYNLTLPNQPLGLNLNFQGFNNIDTPLYNCDINNKDVTAINQPPSPHSSSSSSYSYCYSGVFDANVEHGDTKMHLAMDEKEMEEIRSIGEKHDIEWNDSVNLAASAWWSKFLDSLEVDAMEDGLGGDANNSSRLLMQHDLGDYYLQGASSLPCLDIEEIEWVDGDWLS